MGILIFLIYLVKGGSYKPSIQLAPRSNSTMWAHLMSCSIALNPLVTNEFNKHGSKKGSSNGFVRPAPIFSEADDL